MQLVSKTSVRQSTVFQHMHTYKCTVNNMNMTFIQLLYINIRSNFSVSWAILSNSDGGAKMYKVLKAWPVTIHIQWSMKNDPANYHLCESTANNIHMYHTEKSLVVNVFWRKCFFDMLVKNFLANLMLKIIISVVLNFVYIQNGCWPPCADCTIMMMMFFFEFIFGGYHEWKII